jgi:hypothetical protein
MNKIKLIDSQHKSPLFALPFEIREKIYAADKSVARVIEESCRRGRADLYVVVEPSEVKTKRDVWSVLRMRDSNNIDILIQKPIVSKNLYRVALYREKIRIAEEKVKKTHPLFVGGPRIGFMEVGCALGDALRESAEIGFIDAEVVEKYNLFMSKVSSIPKISVSQYWFGDLVSRVPRFLNFLGVMIGLVD